MTGNEFKYQMKHLQQMIQNRKSLNQYDGLLKDVRILIEVTDDELSLLLEL